MKSAHGVILYLISAILIAFGVLAGHMIKVQNIELRRLTTQVSLMHETLPQSVKMAGYVTAAVDRLVKYLPEQEAFDLAVSIYNTCVEWDIDPYWFEAIGQYESLNWSVKISDTNDYGYWHVNAATARMIKNEPGLIRYGVTSPDDLLNNNIGAAFGAYYLRNELDTYGPNYGAIIRGYNGGPACAALYLKGKDVPTSVNTYYSRVEAIYNIIKP